MFVLESGLFDTPAWGVIAPQSLHLTLQTKSFPHPSQNSLEQRKEITFDRRLPYVTDLVFRGFYCPSSENLMEKALHEITANSQGELHPFSPIFGSLATPQRHIIRSPDT